MSEKGPVYDRAVGYLVGAKVIAVTEHNGFPVLVFDTGTVAYLQRDSEGNGPGVLMVYPPDGSPEALLY